MLAIVREEDRAALEGVIAAHCADQAWTEAATAAIRGYGPEILGYLFAATRRDQDTAEVFSDVCEDLWRGLPGFRFAASLRTWAYTLARHALYNHARDPRRRHAFVDPSHAPELAQVAERVRSTTVTYLRSEKKSQIARLREALDPRDRTLLILRVDRGLPWEDIARVLDDDGHALDDAELRRRSAALRKRFERIKDRLRKLAEAETS
jgi:RNA polymerase sigma-70 factor (ECF subfamily)